MVFHSEAGGSGNGASCAGVSVARLAGGCRVVALTSFAPGEIVLRFEGEPRNRPSRHTIQLGAGLHMGAPEAGNAEDLSGRYPWRFLNHSCDPNAAVRERQLIAVRPIHPGEDLTFNYNTTEYDMASPFACHCGSLFCAGQIRGFKYLDRQERERLRPLLNPHLVRLLDGHGEAVWQPIPA